MSEESTRLLERVLELEGIIRQMVSDNPNLFCCYNCIPSARKPPRICVEDFEMGLELECNTCMCITCENVADTLDDNDMCSECVSEAKDISDMRREYPH